MVNSTALQAVDGSSILPMDTRLNYGGIMCKEKVLGTDHKEELDRKRLECFAKKTTEQVMKFFDEVEKAHRYFVRSNPALTEDQHKCILAIRKAIKDF